MGGTQTKPTTEEGWSKRVGGANKVKRPASAWAEIPECPCTGLEPLFKEEGCNVFIARSVFPVVRWVMGLHCTMTVYRAANGEVTLVNAFRVPANVEDEILALGPVRHIVTLGGFHGASDAYYLTCGKFGTPTHWTPVGGSVAPGLPDAKGLTEDSYPVDGAQVVPLESPYPECALVLPLGVTSGGNVLVACDALVHAIDTRGIPPIGRVLLNAFMGLATQGTPEPAPLWCKHQKVAIGQEKLRPYYARILDELEWSAVVTAHGPAVVDCNRDNLRRAVEKALNK